jgi:shikimate kinase
MSEKSNIALIGFRASGKSLLGKLLAQELNLSFVDMDERLVASFGKSIDQWVRSEGWESFRKAESELLEQIAWEQGLVVATGGGVVLSTHNRNLLREHFFVIWLKTSPETTHLRMIADPNTGPNRPAFTTLPLREEIERVLAERSIFYEETAHITLETDDALPAQLVSRVIRQLLPEEKVHDRLETTLKK